MKVFAMFTCRIISSSFCVLLFLSCLGYSRAILPLTTVCSKGNELAFCQGTPLAIAELRLSTGASLTTYWILFRDCRCELNENTMQILEKRKPGSYAILFNGTVAAFYGYAPLIQNGLKSLIVSNCANLADNTPTCFDTLEFNGKQYQKKGQSFKPDPNLTLEIDSVILDSLTNIQLDLKASWQQALLQFKAGDKKAAASFLLSAAGSVPYTITPSTVSIYNDLGFFLAEAGRNSEAKDVLETVLTQFPDRTVAYLNIGDVYFALKDLAKAKNAYIQYIALMKKTGKEKNIPARAIERSK